MYSFNAVYAKWKQNEKLVDWLELIGSQLNWEWMRDVLLPSSVFVWYLLLFGIRSAKVKVKPNTIETFSSTTPFYALSIRLINEMSRVLYIGTESANIQLDHALPYTIYTIYNLLSIQCHASSQWMPTNPWFSILWWDTNATFNNNYRHLFGIW